MTTDDEIRPAGHSK